LSYRQRTKTSPPALAEKVIGRTPVTTPVDGVEVALGFHQQLKLLTLQETATYARVSISTVRRWIRGGELPTYTAGRQKRVDEKALVQFLSGPQNLLWL
jgi:excisionase family DNA binding protein